MRRSGRWIGFAIAVILGVIGGLFYGWAISPAPYADTSLSSLRQDYKTDFILMVAELYHIEKDPGLAVERLAPLGDQSPARMVQQAILTTQTLGYDRQDIERLAQLSQVLLTIPSTGTNK